FYSTAFLTNHNHVDLGIRQNGVKLDDVVLPPYATSPQHFIALHMQALESEYVSQHLHLWIDLVFGDKQRGPAALEAHNVFFYLTYEGLVDIDAITDPVLQASMRAQIAHFGQTPSQLLREPHVARHIPDTLPPGGLVPLLLPHVHPIALVEFVSVTALLCLDTTGMLSMQKFTSPTLSTLRSYSLQGELLATTTSTELPVTKLVPFSRTAHVVAAGPMGANVVAVHSMMEVQPLTTVGVSSAALSVDEKVAILGLDVMPAQLLAIAMGI
ncbi:hypothetical protein AaE_005648, partial [Aphanomyces astaci]